jgi:UPF0755 protein
VVTGSDQPPNGNSRATTPARAAQTGVGGKTSTPGSQGVAPAANKPAGVAASTPMREAAGGVAAASGAAKPAPNKPAPSTPPPQTTRPAMPADKQPLKSAAAAPPTNGKAGGAAPVAGPRAAAAPSARPVTGERPAATKAQPGAGEPYPPSSVNGGGVASAAKNTAPITPRSPRTALEPDKVEMPSNRSRDARHPFVVVGNAIISFFVLAAIAAGVALFLGKQRFDEPGPLPEDRIVNIPRGSGIRDIADVLVHDGVIDQPWVFVGGVLVLKAREDLKAGEYQFKAHASLRDVVATIVDGRVVPHQITIPEGLTSEQIVARLLDDDILTGNIKEIPREGTLLPDTYNFTRGITREQIIQRMQQVQQRLVKEIWDRHSPDLPLKNADQLVVLASLVERETGKPEERTRVAAVFVNRLKQKMRLQSDPTIIYGLVGGKGTLGRPLTRNDIDQATPYNTYQVDGLPPGPIANPGRASLEAAANPARTRELYFVADGTGGHAFAETYEQHQKNVARLRAFEADQKDQGPADAQLVSSPPQPAAAPGASTPQRRTGTRRNQTQQTAH